MGRKAKGTAEPRVLADGSTVYVARVRKRYLGTERTEREANALCDEYLKREREHGGARSLGRMSAAWLDEREVAERERRHHGGNTRDNRYMWNKHVLRTSLATRGVGTIKPAELQRIVDASIGQPIARWDKATRTHVVTGAGVTGAPCARRVRALLRAFFTWADVAPNPAAALTVRERGGAKTFKAKIGVDKRPHLHADEIASLYALSLADFSIRERAMYGCGIYAGLRPGEILGLRWEYVGERVGDRLLAGQLDGRRSEIWIRHSYDALPKNEVSQREVPIIPELRALLIALRDSLPARPISGLVFPRPDGGMYGRQYNGRWRTRKSRIKRVPGLRDYAGVRAHIQWRHMRHTFATHAINGTGWSAGHRWDVLAVSMALGHTNTKMTLDHYASPDTERLHAEVDAGQRARAAVAPASTVVERIAALTAELDALRALTPTPAAPSSTPQRGRRARR